MEETKRWSEGVVGFGKETPAGDLLARMRQELDSLGPTTPPPVTPPPEPLNRKQRRAAARAKARGKR